MALDVSSIVSAVNKYLYSISDMNKLATEADEASSTSVLSGLFEKILSKAVSDEKESAVKDIDVSSALQSLSATGTSDSTNDGTSSFDVSLPSLIGSASSVSLDDASADAILAKALAISSGAKNSNGTASAVASYDRLGIRAEIENNISNHSLTVNIGDAFEKMDIKGKIEESIEKHNRIDEISSYNAARLSAYKNSSSEVANTSVFGDFKL
jgi:hypothetical protein